MSSPGRRTSPLSTGYRLPGDPYGHEVPRQSHRKVQEGVNVISRTLRNENDLLRYQLNDIIAREKNQRIELQRLRAHRDVEVASLVQAATQQLKGEVEQMKVLLQSTSAQLLQALTEKEKAVNDSQDAMYTVDELKRDAEVQESSIMNQLRDLEAVFSKTCGTVTALANSVQGFQRHVLPTFKPLGTDLIKLTKDLSNKPGPTQRIVSELKQENEDLKAKLQCALQKTQVPIIADQKTIHPTSDNCNDIVYEQNILHQELESLQNLYNVEVKQLKAKLKCQDEEEVARKTQFCDIQHECIILQNKVEMLEGVKTELEIRLKDETSTRSQLVSQIFNMRKENENIRTELETLKLNQKFLTRQPRSGCIPVEKMDLMNTINQLLLEMNKLKNDKVTLEEELKVQRRCHMRDEVKRIVTVRDVSMAASNKVGDGELASKLAMTRIDQLSQKRILSPVFTSQLALTFDNSNHTANLTNFQGQINSIEPRMEAP